MAVALDESAWVAIETSDRPEAAAARNRARLADCAAGTGMAALREERKRDFRDA